MSTITTPAYSVLTLLILGYTLAAYPAGVFAQEEVNGSVDTPETATTTEVEAVAVPAGTPQGRDVYEVDQLVSERIYSDFVVGPGRFDLEVAPGETKVVEMLVTNRMGIPKKFKLSTEDIEGSTDPGTTVVMLKDEVGPYSLKNFISVPEEEFWLEHSERARVPVTISLPADAEPGGFYGTLLTQITSEDIDQGDEGVNARSKLINRIGTLFFITTPGDIERSMELKEFSTLNHQKFFSEGPISFNIVHENTGSIHTTPFGELRIFNTLGNEVGFAEIAPWYVLPKSVRNREIVWNREFLVGRYTAVVEIDRSYDGVVDKVSYTFWVIPLQLVAAVFGGFFVFFIILRFIFSRFEFRRKGN